MQTRVKPSMFASPVTELSVKQKFENALDVARLDDNPYGITWVAILPNEYSPKHAVVDIIYDEETAQKLSQFIQITAVFATDNRQDLSKHAKVACRYAKEWEQRQSVKG